MQEIKLSVIESESANFTGCSCDKCGQIAFRVVVVTVDGKDVKLPLCGKHYMLISTVPGTS